MGLTHDCSDQGYHETYARHETVAAFLGDSEGPAPVEDDGGGPYIALRPPACLHCDDDCTCAELFIDDDGWWRYQLAGEVVEVSACHAGTPPSEVAAWVRALPWAHR